MFGPASAAASLQRAARRRPPAASVCADALGRVAAAAFGCGMLAGMLYVLAGAALLAARVDVYCTRYTGTPRAEHDAACGTGNGGLLTCAAGACACSADCEATQREALLALEPNGNATALAAWRADGHPCVGGGWPGVTCDAHALVTQLDVHGVRLGGNLAPLAVLGMLVYVNLADTGVEGDVKALAPLAELAYMNLNGTEATGFPLAITDGCCNFVDASHPYCVVRPGADAACAAVVQATTQAAALLAFKTSGGAATATALASWRSGTDPCGVPKWAGVTCSGGAAPAVTELDLDDDHVAGQIGTLALLAVDLTYLNLDFTAATGDVKGLAPLVKLTALGLADTKVTGQAAAMAPLSRLTALLLDGTAVAGCGGFCGAGGPFHTNCDPHPDPHNGCYCNCP